MANAPVLNYPAWLPEILDVVPQLLGVSINWSDYSVLLTIGWAVLAFTLIAIVAKASVVFMVLMERKVLAWLTQRVGPNRVGPWGLLQTLADGIKLLFKEDIMSKGSDKFLFTLGPAVFFTPTFIFFALLPFTDSMLAVALPAGALFVFAISSISVVGMVLSGWGSNNKYSLLGGMRSAAQAISYEVPLVLAVLAVVLFTGTMNIADIVRGQTGPFWNWYGFVLTPISFFIFFISALAEVNRIPFDLPEAESELVSGYNTEYTGMKFALFFLAEYAALFAMSGFITAFFAGGYFSPTGNYLIEYLTKTPYQDLTGIFQLVVQVEMLFWFLAKTYFFIFLAMWIRATLPRLKPDQLMGFSWKFLIPLSLVNIFVIALGKFFIAPGGIENIGDQAILSSPGVWITWAMWVGFAVGVYGLFFWFSSNSLNQKLEMRLVRR
ncbi:MAG: NADH-quinone oxidoreductase subunit NuoH [Cyanobacteria bacterium P01_H01_bin.74]